MTQKPTVAPHADDGDLIRYLDHQVSPDERRWLLAHLVACEACSRRMHALGEQSQAVSALVGSLDEGAGADELTRARALSAARRAHPRARSPFRGLRVAAVAALAAIGTLGIQPVRAWVVERLSGLVAADAVEAPAPVPPTTVVESGSVVRFEPTSDTFVLEIEHAQDAGAVVLEMRDVAQASAEIAGSGSETIIVLPSGLRVENTPASTASYHFTLPAGLRLIQVFAGGRPVAIIPVDDPELPWSQTVPLRSGQTAR